MRTFTSPSGRKWTARLYYYPASPCTLAASTAPASFSALRFESDGVTLDLADWPSDWLDRCEESLVALLREAQPPR